MCEEQRNRLVPVWPVKEHTSDNSFITQLHYPSICPNNQFFLFLVRIADIWLSWQCKITDISSCIFMLNELVLLLPFLANFPFVFLISKWHVVAPFTLYIWKYEHNVSMMRLTTVIFQVTFIFSNIRGPRMSFNCLNLNFNSKTKINYKYFQFVTISN